MAVDEGKLSSVVERHSREQVTGEGAGRLYPEATPRNWRENLTPEQVEVVEMVSAPLLDDFYPG
jgi:hypothetical protein